MLGWVEIIREGINIFKGINSRGGFFTKGGGKFDVIGMNLYSDQFSNIIPRSYSYNVIKNVLLPLIAVFIKVVSRCFLKRYKYIRIEGNIKYTYRKSKKPVSKPKILLAIPCLCIFLMISFQARESFGEVDKIKNEFDKIKNDLTRDFFFTKLYLSISKYKDKYLK